MNGAFQTNLRELPSVDEVLSWPELRASNLAHPVQVSLVRQVLGNIRAESKKANEATDLSQRVRQEVLAALSRHRLSGLRRVVNATGVILHTNLGRAPLAAAAVQRVAQTAGGYSTVEFEVSSGERGERLAHVRTQLCTLFESEAALVVNNNAAAVMLAIRTFLQKRAPARQVVISRGELVEIGGSFRIPEIIEASGASLCEVGTTNRTHLYDYERALGPETALLLKVHPSNFRQAGFTHNVETRELVALGRQHGVPVMEDLGSGHPLSALSAPPGRAKAPALAQEPSIIGAVSTGVEALTFSGDKLLGGPQAGIILGSQSWLAAMQKDPLYRALRLSKLDLAALEATLELYLQGRAHEEIPLWRALGQPEEILQSRAQQLCAQLKGRGFAAQVERQFSQVGGGSVPAVGIPTWVVTVRGGDVQGMAKALRERQVPIVARIQDDQVVLDLRTVLDKEEAEIAAAFVALSATLSATLSDDRQQISNAQGRSAT